MPTSTRTSHFLGHSGLEVICYVVIWALQLLIIQNGMETVRRFQDWAGPAVWVMMLILAIGLCVKAGGFSFTSDIPDGRAAGQDQGRRRERRARLVVGPVGRGARSGSPISPRSTSTSATSRAMPRTRRRVSKGNLWGLPVNLILFSLVAGVTTIAAFKVYGEVLLHPDQISAKFDSWFLALLAALTFAVATLGINVVANFVSPAFDFSNVFPRQIDFKKGGYIAARRSRWCSIRSRRGRAMPRSFVNVIGATMGPLFGVIMVDYYLVRKGNVNVEALYRENGEFRFRTAGTSMRS